MFVAVVKERKSLDDRKLIEVKAHLNQIAMEGWSNN